MTDSSRQRGGANAFRKEMCIRDREWTALDMAIMSIGALTVPVYETNSASQVSWIFNDSKVTLAIAEDDGQRDKIERCV